MKYQIIILKKHYELNQIKISKFYYESVSYQAIYSRITNIRGF